MERIRNWGTGTVVNNIYIYILGGVPGSLGHGPVVTLGVNYRASSGHRMLRFARLHLGPTNARRASVAAHEFHLPGYN